MAGSLNHIIDDETGKYREDLIENLGDAGEALEECFNIIYAMTGGDKNQINEYCESLNYPTIEHDMVL